MILLTSTKALKPFHISTNILQRNHKVINGNNNY
jgi:hypothetical protein